MPELFKGVDQWFLILCGLGFLFLANRSFSKFDETQKRFQELFDKVFERHDNFESRLSKIEGRCEDRDC